MIEFSADPVLEPGQTAFVAERTRAGQALAWKPGGDPDQLAAFVGGAFVVVAGELYERWPNGQLTPMGAKLSYPQVWIKPTNGDPYSIRVDEFKAQYVTISAPRATDEQVDAFHAADLATAWTEVPGYELLSDEERAALIPTVAADLVGDGITDNTPALSPDAAESQVATEAAPPAPVTNDAGAEHPPAPASTPPKKAQTAKKGAPKK